MSTPIVGALTGTNYVQQFPVNVPPYNVSPSHFCMAFTNGAFVIWLITPKKRMAMNAAL
jgi:hypothetical protein